MKKNLDDCVYYWIGGTENGRWRKAVGADLRKLRAEIEYMGYRVVYGRTAIGAPDGPPRKKI